MLKDEHEELSKESWKLNTFVNVYRKFKKTLRKMEEIGEIGEIDFLKTMMDKLDLYQEKVDKMDNESEKLDKMLRTSSDIIYAYKDIVKSLHELDKM